ncbi:MAG TPA: SLBB domain-containing protein [bacterium]|nr:SLBB domain-containing protein [bacterium]HPN45594.1 SLBB domain-containing protein [bacterium]
MMKNSLLIIVFFSITGLFADLMSQDILKKDDYIIGEDGKLQFTVHIWGEVERPGEYVVPDKTDLLELISKAGGPTEYSNLNNITITRGLLRYGGRELKLASVSSARLKANDLTGKMVVKVNMKKILEKNDFNQLLPTLQPGDIVMIGRNNWYRWQTVVRVISQLAIVAQVWYYWSNDRN